MSVSRLDAAANCLSSLRRFVVVSRNDDFLHTYQVVEERRQHFVQIAFILLFKIVPVLRLNLVFSKVEFDLSLPFNIELHSYEVMNS